MMYDLSQRKAGERGTDPVQGETKYFVFCNVQSFLSLSAFLSAAHSNHTHTKAKINQSINQDYDAFSQDHQDEHVERLRPATPRMCWWGPTIVFPLPVWISQRESIL